VSTPDGASAQQTILVVDDQPHIVRLLQVNLERVGYRVITAADGIEGLEQVAAEHPDLIILDVVMPRKDGFAVLKELKDSAEFRHIPVIMLTVKAQSMDVLQGLRMGAEMYLPKPFHPKDLTMLAERLLSGERFPDTELPV